MHALSRLYLLICFGTAIVCCHCCWCFLLHNLSTSTPAAAAAAARAATPAAATAASAEKAVHSRPTGVSSAATEGLGGFTEQQQQEQQQQGGLHALSGYELRSLLLQRRTILSFDLGTTKTGLAVAVRRPPLRSVSAAAAVAAAAAAQHQQQQQQQQQNFAAAGEEGLLQATSLVGLFSVAPLKLLQHGSSRASLVSLLLQQQQQQQADLLLLGLPLNPRLPPDLRFTTHRVSRHLAVARALQQAAAAAATTTATAAAAAGGSVTSAAPVLVLDESYTTWRALKARSKESNDWKTGWRPSDPSAACELLRDLLAAATAASGGPTNVFILRPTQTLGASQRKRQAPTKPSFEGPHLPETPGPP
ncbi:hypothetical protein Emed_003236 [Eimeria media]